MGQQQIRKANPVVVGEKIQKIWKKSWNINTILQSSFMEIIIVALLLYPASFILLQVNV